MPRNGQTKRRAPKRSAPRQPRTTAYPHAKVLENGQAEDTILIRRPGFRAGSAEGALRPTIEAAPPHIIPRSHNIRLHLIADRAVRLVWGNREGTALNLGSVPPDWAGASITVVNPAELPFTVVIDATTAL
jgi:hypothetical protein